MWLIKGREISFQMDDGETVSLSKDYGMIHSPDTAKKCHVYFGPFTNTDRPVSELPPEASEYFGRDYEGTDAYVSIPSGRWRFVGNVTDIWYERRGNDQKYYHHDFSQPVRLESNGRYHRLVLPNGCVVDDRGFVVP